MSITRRTLVVAALFSILFTTVNAAREDARHQRDVLLRAAKIAQTLSETKLVGQGALAKGLPAISGTGAISGKVLGAENSPIPEAWVVAWSTSIIDPTKNFARTDAEGNYVIDGLPTGNYIVAAEAEGYFPEFYNNARSMMDATPVHVEEPNTVTGIDFSLELRSAGGGAISGVVTDGTGNPVVEARVNVFSMTNPFHYGEAITGLDGTYKVSGLASGDFYVAVWAEGYLMEFYDNVHTLEQATPVHVIEPLETSGINFELGVGGSISGTVTTDTGEPIAEAFVEAGSRNSIQPGHDFGGWGFAFTDTTGHYTITGLMTGEYIVSAQAWNRWTYAIEWYDNVESPEFATPVPVVEGQETPNINFSLSLNIGTGSISGRVTDTAGHPLPEVLVQASSGRHDPTGTIGVWAHAFTDAEGYYRIDELPAGEYIVSAHYWDGRIYIERWYNNVGSPDQATPVVVADGQETPGIDFTIPITRGTGSISGTVTSDDGRPLAEVLVQAWLPEQAGDWWGSVGYAFTNELGEYVIGELAAGTYLVSADYFREWIHVREWYDNVESADLAMPVSVADSQDTPNINFALDTNGNLGAISGRVFFDVDRSPIAYAFVEAHRLRNDPIGHVRGHGFAYTDREGNYVIPYLPVGEYYVSVFAEGVHEFYNDATFVDQATPVSVLEDDTTGGIDFGITVPPDTGGSISGTVSDDSTGYPVVSAVVIALPRWVVLSLTPVRFFHHDYFRFATTDSLGNYTISNLDDGAYYVFCFAEGYIGEFYDDVYDPGQATLVEIQAGIDLFGIGFGLSRWQNVGPGLLVGGGSLEGIVNGADGLAIEGVYVYVLDADGNAVGFGHSLADGSYSISGLREGSYHLQASRLGYGTEFYGGASSLEGSIPLSLGANSGLTLESVDFTLEPSSLTGVELEPDEEIPTSFQLHQNFPNPFNPTTEIRYDMPVDAIANLTVYDLLGQEIATLVHEYQRAGSYTVSWDGRDISGREVPSGIYFYRLHVRETENKQVRAHSLVRKAVLLR